ncbi:MAG: fibronectin type III domain-containing protein [Lewinellaceae bacterium]|nr:fibronectin type III domain-containing protein [Lewinellaceae bacterium]
MTRFSLIIVRSFGLASVLSLLSATILPAQTTGYVAEWLESYHLSGSFQQVQMLSIAQERTDLQTVVDQATILEPDPAVLNQLLQTAPLTITYTIPNAYGETFELELVKTEILAPGFTLGSLGANAAENLPYQPGLHYRGLVKGRSGSLASVSFFETGVMAMINDGNDVFQLGQLEDDPGRYILYRVRDLKAASPFTCFTEDESAVPGEESVADDRGVGCKTVQVYFECDYKMYVDKGSSTTNVTNYVTGFFNQVATLYANENVGIAISQIYVWTSSDPYASYGSTSSVLNAFRATRGTNFTGNLAHFLSTRNLGGGIAYLDVICFKNYAHGVSAINNSYQNVPTFSWTVEVVTHELGHNLGSWHTHSCNWPGGALDNCYTPEGGCASGPAPSNGGTIMSYCHLTSYGINFNNGFGSVPGNRIRTQVQNASCLTSSGTVPAGLTASNITGSSAKLSWGAVAGATTYTVQYKTSAASTWTTAGTSTSASFNLTGLAATTTYNWQVKTDCSNYSATASFTTVSGGGGGTACNPPTGLANTNITASSATLSWTPVSDAANYTVQYKKNTSATWSTAGTTSGSSYALSGLSAATGYNWQVKANCSGYSGVASFSTLSSGGGGGSACNPPSALNNNTVTAKTAAISWSPVSGASNYTLQIKYASSSTWYTLGTVSATQVTISGLQASTSYHWRVRPSCSTVYSAAKLLTTPASLIGEEAEEISVPVVSYLQLYPNPAADHLNLEYTGDITTNTEIRVQDITGRMVLRQNCTQENQVLDVSRLQAGLYILSVTNGEKQVAQKRFVKAN